MDQGFVPGDVKEIIIGPTTVRELLSWQQPVHHHKKKAEAIEAIEKAGYKVKSQLLPDVSIGYGSDFKSKFWF